MSRSQRPVRRPGTSGALPMGSRWRPRRPTERSPTFRVGFWTPRVMPGRAVKTSSNHRRRVRAIHLTGLTTLRTGNSFVATSPWPGLVRTWIAHRRVVPSSSGWCRWRARRHRRPRLTTISRDSGSGSTPMAASWNLRLTVLLTRSFSPTMLESGQAIWAGSSVKSQLPYPSTRSPG